MLSKDIIAKLTPEQLVIAEKWEQERFERAAILSQVSIGVINISDALEQMRKITPEYCEHGRSIMGTCFSCEEIERIVRPEAFSEEDE